MSDTAIERSLAHPAPRTTDSRRVWTEYARALRWQILPFIVPVLLFSLWLGGSSFGWIAPQVLPAPHLVLETLLDLARSGDLWSNTWISLSRVLVGFAAGAALGLLLGSGLGLSRTLESYVMPSFNALVQIPVLGWLPFLLLLVGIGEPLKYLLIGQAALVPVTLSTLQGFRQAPAAYYEVADVFRYSRWQLITEVVFPAALPTIATGVRLAFTKAWLALVVVELVASSQGLGYLIVYGRQLFQLDLVMAAVIVVGAIGYAIDRLLNALEARLTRGARRASPPKPTSTAPQRWRGAVLPLLALGLWWGVSATGISRSGLLVSPQQVWHTGIEQTASGALWRALSASLARELTGFALGTAGGLVLGGLLGFSRLAERVLGPSFNTFKQISLFAWIPLISVWFGLGDAAKVVFLSLAALLPVVAHVNDGIRNVSPELLEVARVYRYTRWQAVVRVVLPAALPSVFTGIYLALIYSWLATLGAEYLLVAGSGIGNMLIDGSEQFRMDLVLFGIVVIGIVGWALNASARLLERRVFAHRSR